MLIIDASYQGSDYSEYLTSVTRWNADSVSSRNVYLNASKNRKTEALIDFGSLSDPISSYMTGYTWGVNLPYSVNSVNLTDDLGNPISKMPYTSKPYRQYQASLDLKMGDVNYSGKADTADATLVLQYAGLISANTLDMALADVDDSGAVDVADAVLILQTAAGLVQKKFCETLDISGAVQLQGIKRPYSQGVISSFPELESLK